MHENQRSKFQRYLAARQGYSTEEVEQGKVGLFAHSDNYRLTRESKELCELGDNFTEKYGCETGWRIGLRNRFISNEGHEPQPE